MYLKSYTVDNGHGQSTIRSLQNANYITKKLVLDPTASTDNFTFLVGGLKEVVPVIQIELC